MTTPSTTPVPSRLAQDLLFNAEKIDRAVNSSQLTYVDRLGVARMTLAGAVDAIASTNPRGPWASGVLYSLKDLVTVGGVVYICVSTHTSGATFIGDAARWGVFQGVTYIDLADTSSGAKNAGLMKYQADLVYSVDTVGRELQRWINLDHFVTDTTGVTGVSSDIIDAIEKGLEVGAICVYGNPGSKYRLDSKIDMSGAKNIILDFFGAEVIDDVQQFRGDLGGRGDHAFLLYASSGVTVRNAKLTVAPTRAVLNPEVPSCTFWIGGQSEGDLHTRWATVENFDAYTPITGMMFGATLGEASGIHFRRIDFTGRWSYGVNFEYGNYPVDPAVNNTLTNGAHAYNILVEELRGFDLLDCRGFLRTAACYNVKFLNCQGYNVRNFIYGYVGDRNISRFSQNVIYENCKTKGVSDDFLAEINYDAQFLSVNKDGSTGDALPAWTNYRHMWRLVNCEFQSGSKLGNACVRLFGNQGIVFLDQCILRDSYYGVRGEPSSNPDYITLQGLVLSRCIFVNNFQDLMLLSCRRVQIEKSKFEAQNPASTLVPVRINDSPGAIFDDNRFSGKSAAGPVYWMLLTNSSNARLRDNDFTVASISDHAIDSQDSTMRGGGNTCNGLLTKRDLNYMGIVGEPRSMNRDLVGVSGSSITFEKGNNYDCGSAVAQTVGRIFGGQVGETVTFRGTGSTASVTFQNAAGSVPTTERLLNKTLADQTMTGNNWSRTFMKLDSGWWEI